VIKNIILIRAITNKGYYVVFEPSKCWVTNLQNLKNLVATRVLNGVNKLYKL